MKIYHQSTESVVRSVCFRGDFTIKAVVGFVGKLAWKMCHTLKHFIHIQYFSWWLVLVSYVSIVLALVRCRNPNNVHCFGTIFPNQNFVFVICVARPPGPSALRRIEVGQLSNAAVGAARLILIGPEQSHNSTFKVCICEMTWYLYTRGVRGRMKEKNDADFNWLCHEWFRHVHVSQSRSAVTSAENPASENSPQSIGELVPFMDTWLICKLCQPG